jgi:hypothetical protein
VGVFEFWPTNFTPEQVGFVKLFKLCNYLKKIVFKNALIDIQAHFLTFNLKIITYVPVDEIV